METNTTTTRFHHFLAWNTMNRQPSLFDLPPIDSRRGVRLRPIREPVWTRNKARLIERYLNLFVMVTRHGVYIDGFAGPQRKGEDEAWAAKLVLESKPPLLRNFLLVDDNKNCVTELEKLKDEQPSINGRTINLWHGDFNSLAEEVLASSPIREKTASFCLLDQRTFECHWETVQNISKYKTGYKIELFYFFGTSWFDRAISGLNEQRKAKVWWGRNDLDEFLRKPNGERPQLLAERFQNELGYATALAWPILGQNRRVMYHMIHATDHPEAPKLMNRAYKKATGSALTEPDEQLELEYSPRHQVPDARAGDSPGAGSCRT